MTTNATTSFIPARSALSDRGLREKLKDGLNIYDGAMCIIREVYAEYLVYKYIALFNEEKPTRSLLEWICDKYNPIELYPDLMNNDPTMVRLAGALKLQLGDEQFGLIAELVERRLQQVLRENGIDTEVSHHRDHFTLVRFQLAA